MKVKINHSVTITFAAVGEVEFGKSFLEKVDKSLVDICRQFKGGSVTKTLEPKAITAEFHKVDLGLAVDLKTKVIQEVVLLAEHGPNADLLDKLLDRHPGLRTHPQLTNVVSAFENLNRVLDTVIATDTNAMKAELQRREGLELDPEDLVHSGATKRTLNQVDRASFRDQARLGATEEQQKAAPVPPEQAPIPDVYRKISEAQKAKGGGEKGPANDGNIF